MQKVLVIDTNKNPLMPTHPAKARKLLKSGKAAIWRRFPFTIILKESINEPKLQPIEIKIDPGSKNTGISIVALFARGYVLLWAANLEHKGWLIKKSLYKRRGIRRNRRSRKTRYRQPRFLNRRKLKGWLAPSLNSRVDNIYNWSKKLKKWIPISSIQLELVKFDTQKLANPNIKGVEYQQGELFGYEVREYLLEKWNRKCAYCKIENVPLQIEHIVPKSRGGTNRISNLTIACEKCNLKKGKQTALEFGFSDIQKQAKQPLKDAAIMNSIRYAIGDKLKKLNLPIEFWSGGRTKYNRIRQGYKKDHWIDAACVGKTGNSVYIPKNMNILNIKAMGRGSRQMCKMNKYGFPRTKPKSVKQIHGFQTGDIVKANKHNNVVIGRVAIRKTGFFNVGGIDGINYKKCRLLQHIDGYEYT